MKDFNETFVATPHGTLRVVASGPPLEGAVLLCWPGLGLTALEFHRLLREGEERGVRVVAVDPPGHGRSDPAPHVAFGDMPAILESLGQSLRIGRCLLVGHSAGATALLFGARALPDLAGIVLADGGFHEEAVTGDDGSLRRANDTWMDSLTFPDWETCLADARGHLKGWDANVEAGIRDLFGEQAKGGVRVRGDAGTLTAWAIALRDYRIADVPRLDVPALALWAGSEPGPEPAGISLLRDRLARLSTACLPGSGHELFWDQPEAVSREIWAFADRTSVRP